MSASAASSNLHGATGILGIGSTPYWKRGTSGREAIQLAIEAVLAACDDAGLDPSDIDGFASYSDEGVDPVVLGAQLGIRELRHSSRFWGGGGGGVCGAIENAAVAVHAGRARNVVVFRAIAQPSGERFGQGGGYAADPISARLLAPYGVVSPAQLFGLPIARFDANGDIRSAMMEIALTSYAHAQANPNAVMCGRPLSEEQYTNSRRIVGPLRLYDCCLETDGAAAVIVSSAAMCRESGADNHALILSAVAGGLGRAGAPYYPEVPFPTSNLGPVVKRLYREAGVTPDDIDVLQSYDNFTAGVAMSLVDCGFCSAADLAAFATRANLGVGGRLPINTSGGHLAEGYLQGLGLIVEAVRQIRGTSSNQVDSVSLSMVTGGPLIAPSSACLLGTDVYR